MDKHEKMGKIEFSGPNGPEKEDICKGKRSESRPEQYPKVSPSLE